MALMDKRRYQGRRAQKRVYKKKRRRTGLFVFIGLVVLTAIGFILSGTNLTLQSGSGVVDRVEEPTVTESPEAVSSGEETDKEKSTEEEEEAAPTPPDDPTLFLSIPKLGISNALVTSDESGLETGAMHLPETGFPWENGANTYIAGHRVGWPGTGSDHIFYNLPSLQEGDEIFLRDTNDHEYTYRVSSVFAVTPFDLWVLDPVPGKSMLTLQVCTESLDDWWTIGPSLMSSGPDSGRLMVRADLVT